jgi:8-oxo-dGTP pyrophosphatase MutT (NUDIX family)
LALANPRKDGEDAALVEQDGKHKAMKPHRPLIQRLMQRYWRMTRAVTLGAQAIIRNEKGDILLVLHGYKPGWGFPGGGVEPGEHAVQSLIRELDEEVGVIPEAPPQLFGIYSNFERFPGDHICLYTVSAYKRPRIPAPNREIVDQRFFSPDALPDDTTRGARRRIAELLGKQPVSTDW